MRCGMGSLVALTVPLAVVKVKFLPSHVYARREATGCRVTKLELLE